GILEEYRSEAKGKLLAKYTYGYDPIAKQVQSAIHSGKIFEAYGSGGSVHLEYAYNSRGELTDVDALTGPGGARLPAHEFGAAYDMAGNRTRHDFRGYGSASQTYTINGLNQITSRSNYGKVLIGAKGGGDLEINGGTVAPTNPGGGGYYYEEVSLSNSSAPAWASINVSAGGDSDSVTGYVRKATEAFAYDQDGNLTSDSVFIYKYDAENRLVWIEDTRRGRGMRMIYDYMSRRSREIVYVTSNSSVLSDRTFIYTGLHMIAEVETWTGDVLKTFVWGTDISNTEGGAGGIGGLIMINDKVAGETYFPGYDGRGNLTHLVHADTLELAAAF